MSPIGLKKSPSNRSLLVPVIKGPFLIPLPLPHPHQINFTAGGPRFWLMGVDL